MKNFRALRVHELDAGIEARLETLSISDLSPGNIDTGHQRETTQDLALAGNGQRILVIDA